MAGFCNSQLSLAIPPWIGEMSTGDAYGNHKGRNGESVNEEMVKWQVS